METIKSVIGMTLAIAWLLFAALSWLVFWGGLWLGVGSSVFLLLSHIFN
jgi:hypothetical protein